MRGLVRDDAWMTVGVPAREMPVFVAGDHALLARAPVETAVRLAPADRLHLSGLLWPEARARLERAAWMTREAVGNGQVILFAASPVFRGQTRGSARLFDNVVVYGPGVGASQPLVW